MISQVFIVGSCKALILMKLKKILLFSIAVIFFTFTIGFPVETRRNGYGSYKPSREYKYSMQRNQIPVPKSEPVKPYFRKDGTFVQPHFRVPYGSLKSAAYLIDLHSLFLFRYYIWLKSANTACKMLVV